MMINDPRLNQIFKVKETPWDHPPEMEEMSMTSESSDTSSTQDDSLLLTMDTPTASPAPASTPATPVKAQATMQDDYDQWSQRLVAQRVLSESEWRERFSYLSPNAFENVYKMREWLEPSQREVFLNLAANLKVDVNDPQMILVLATGFLSSYALKVPQEILNASQEASSLVKQDIQEAVQPLVSMKTQWDRMQDQWADIQEKERRQSSASFIEKAKLLSDMQVQFEESVRKALSEAIREALNKVGESLKEEKKKASKDIEEATTKAVEKATAKLDNVTMNGKRDIQESIKSSLEQGYQSLMNRKPSLPVTWMLGSSLATLVLMGIGYLMIH